MTTTLNISLLYYPILNFPHLALLLVEVANLKGRLRPSSLRGLILWSPCAFHILAAFSIHLVTKLDREVQSDAPVDLRGAKHILPFPIV